MRILVTGGGGFVGRYVVERLLERGDRVRSFGRSPQPELAARGVEVHCGDLADAAAVEEAVAGVGAVFHVAAKAGVWGDWDGYFEANVRGSRNVVAACRRQGVGRLVHTSTPSVIFNRKSHRGADESQPYGRRWLCPYAHTKAIAERETLAANSDSLRVCALRPHLVFGPGDPHLLPRVVESVLAGRLKIVGDGANRVDVAYVEDVADAHLRAFDGLSEGRGAGRAYFISQGRPVALWPWLNDILERLGHPPLERRIPFPLGYAAGAVAETAWRVFRLRGEPPLTRFVATELATDHYFDISAARRDFGFVPVTEMEAALRATVKDLIKRGYGAPGRKAG